MAIKINWQDLLKRYINWQEIVRVYKNGGQIRPETVPPVFDDYLCFTAEQSNSKVGIYHSGTALGVTIEMSYDKVNWMSSWPLLFGVTLSNIGDKLYLRNTSETPTGFNTGTGASRFTMSWKIRVSWDVTSLLCKYGTNTLSDYCFRNLFAWCTSLTAAPSLPHTAMTPSCYSGMFWWCTSLTIPPELPATTLADRCYARMFNGCSSLNSLPELPATTLAPFCYYEMFAWADLIALSTTQVWEYQTEYRIPSSWTWVDVSGAMVDMFSDTWWTFTGTPSINTIYYTSNQVI